MNEGFQANNNNNEDFERKKYEDFRNEILNFKDLPESTFSGMRNSGDARKLELDEAKNIYAHEIMSRINNYFRDTPHDEKRQQLYYELVHLFEKEILGLGEKRKMYNEDGSEFI